MLSEQSSRTIRATLPAVGAVIEEITAVFYRRMFEAHPELLRDLFNRGNQANGEQRQALAGSIAAFATALLDHPESLPEAMLSRIANKHASLGVTPDQYKIVHHHLFAAMADVLGTSLTPEAAAAWDEVYWLMAEKLITEETRLYRDADAADGDVWRQMEIVGRHTESVDAISLTLRPADEAPAPPFRPGQYISVQVPLADGARQIRQYSLSSAPHRPFWRITVKRLRGESTPEGEVSSRLHEHARIGEALTVSAPFGDLVLTEGDGPLLLASAGVGGTPLMAMLDHLAATGSTRAVTVVHADRSPAHHAHRDEQRRQVDALADAGLHLWYEEPGSESQAHRGQADLGAVDLPPGLTAYLCGPLPFMRAARGELLRRGVAAEAIHYEVFGPDLWLARR